MRDRVTTSMARYWLQLASFSWRRYPLLAASFVEEAVKLLSGAPNQGGDRVFLPSAVRADP
jgi:hypothetical protein